MFNFAKLFSSHAKVVTNFYLIYLQNIYKAAITPVVAYSRKSLPKERNLPIATHAHDIQWFRLLYLNIILKITSKYFS